MGRTEIVQPNGVVGQVEGEIADERLGRRVDHHGVVVGERDAALEPAPCRIVGGHQLEHVLAEQEAELGVEVGDRPGVAGARAEAGRHGGERLRVGQDGQIGEHDVAVGVIEVAVGVDHRAQRLAGRCLDGSAELAGEPRILLGVDDDGAGRRLDRAGVGVAASADLGMDARRDGDEMGFGRLLGHALPVCLHPPLQGGAAV